MRTKTQFMALGIFVLLSAVILGFYLCRWLDDQQNREENQRVERVMSVGPNMDRALESLASAWRDENRRRP